MKLGKAEIDALTCPPGKRDVMVYDDELRGFGVRVTSAGAKIFVFEYRHRATGLHRLVLGHYGDPLHGKITVAQARRQAAVLRGAVMDHRDPWAERRGGEAAQAAAEAAEEAARERQATADAFTLEHLVKQWAATGLRTASPTHRKEAPRAVRKCFAGDDRERPNHLARPASSLTSADAQAAVDRIAIAGKHPTAARKARDYARAMFNWGKGRDLVEGNPIAAVKVEGRPESRERALSDAELGAVWRAAMTLDYPFGPLLRLLILTLQRRTEVAGMQWAELDADLTTWTLPAARAKNRKTHLVHLAEPARAILRELAARPRLAGQVHVFTVTGKTAVSGFSNAVEQLRRAIDREAPPAGGPPLWQSPWTLHDFRRTGVTSLARLGVAPHVADRLLNHVGGTIRGVAAVYQRHEFLIEREAALRLWADHVLAVGQSAVAPALPGNVVRLPGRRPHQQ